MLSCIPIKKIQDSNSHLKPIPGTLFLFLTTAPKPGIQIPIYTTIVQFPIIFFTLALPLTRSASATMEMKNFSSCSALLSKLMNHKHGWVFNAPVDVKGLRLRDYYSIIRQPMDLGTVRCRLEKSRYRSPLEFASDVRLTFGNAMTYNQKGDAAYDMAEELLQIFEADWPSIEAEFRSNTEGMIKKEGNYDLEKQRGLGCKIEVGLDGDEEEWEVKPSKILRKDIYSDIGAESIKKEKS
ncbi:hypothetical protein LUZ60_000596 [Juncus effusus]|nr:hypothetical protein LUZ60_000596 [Juncus effusus]